MSIDTNSNHAGDDIKHMLSEVIAQISDADRRSTASLRQMQERLESLGHEARSVRNGVPAGYLPGFDRIEDGMSLLAARIAQSYAAREHDADGSVPGAVAVPAAIPAAPVVDQAYIPATPIAPPVVEAAHAAAIPANANATRFDQEQPNPLSSTTPGLLRARSTTYASDVDTFDVIETLPDTSNEPWSVDTAAALVDIYAGDEALPFHAAALAPKPVAPVAAPVAEDREPAGVEKHWLDGRLSEIAARVERSLAESRSDKALASMEHRLDEFESRMIAVLNGVATKHDVESLANLEVQIRDLRSQFELTHTELMRIDDLERQLSHIAQQTSDENVGAMMTRFVPAPNPAPVVAARSDADFHSVAIAAAEAAASRVATASNGRGNRVEDMHALLAEFIQERRHGEEQTANTLDTLQQAMLRILDRVDAIEPNPATSAYHVSNPYELQHLAVDHAEPDAHRPAFAAPLATPAPSPTPSFEPEIAAAPAQPVPAGDYLAQQRAKMQASVQRAAAAQRDKLKANPDDVADKTSAARPAKPAPAGGSRRLMVSGLALAVVAGGLSAFAVLSSGQRDPSTIVGIASPQAITDQSLGQASSHSAAATVATQNASAAAATEPQSATTSLTDAVVTEPKSNSSYARTQAVTPAPLSGILLQSDDLEPAEAAAPAAPTQGGVKATPVAAQMTDLEQMTAASPNTQSRAALDLPPATVGPLSLRLAAAQGDASAEFEVASRLAEGKGTDQNLKEAVRWYQRSAAQGFAQAQYRLGTFYERGLGMKADAARARTWYQRAADQGNVKAMHNLAVLAAGRSAESPDYTTAARWFSQAASYGLPDSQFNLAVLSESGLGIEKDMVQAAMWFNIAARSGDKEAMRRRDLMKSKMDAKDLAAAEHLVKSWQPIVPEKMANDPRAAGEAWKTRQAASPEAR